MDTLLDHISEKRTEHDRQRRRVLRDQSQIGQA